MEDSQIRNKRKIYQAVGIISGILELTQSQYSSVRVGEDTYSVIVSRKVKENHQPGRIEGFKVYPSIIEGKLGFQLLRVMVEAPERSVMMLKGCWTIYREEPRLIVYRNNKDSDAKTVLQLIWEEAPIATIKRMYWEIEAELKGEKFEVVQAVGPFTPPQTSPGKSANKSEVPRPVLKSEKIAVPPPIMKSARTLIAPKEIEASANEAPEVELIAIGTSGEIEENNIKAKGIASSEIKAIVETASELIAKGASGGIEPAEMEASPVVAEPVTPKRKNAGSKATESKTLSITEGASEAITPENAEAKKMKAKSSSLKKQKSLASDRIFLGKQLPPGK